MAVVRHLARHTLAYVALLAALAGSSFAAASKLAAPNSVGARQVINRSLLANDLKAGQLPKGARGIPGARGPTGAQGPTGPEGAASRPTIATNGVGTTAPPTAPTATLQTASVALPAVGSLLAYARLDSISFSCGGGLVCTLALGLYVDGQPVSGSALSLPSDTICQFAPGLACIGRALDTTLTGVATGVAPGTHSVTLAWKMTSGTVTGQPVVGPGQRGGVRMIRLARHLARNAVAYAALFVALGGTAFAASTLLPRNSVGSAQVIDRSLLKVDLKAGQAVRGSRGVPGAAGPVGRRGPTGPVGSIGTSAGSGGNEPTPPAGPTATYASTTVTMPRAGKLFLLGRMDTLSIGCPPTALCSYTLGLYVDGSPVPGSGYTASGVCITVAVCFGAIFSAVNMAAIATGVPAGAHVITLGGKITLGSATPVTPGPAEVGAMAVG